MEPLIHGWVSLNSMRGLLMPVFFAVTLVVLPVPAQVGGLPDTTNPVHVPDAASGGSAGDDAVIGQARAEAVSFAETLPDYVAKQVTTRYWTRSSNRGAKSWLPLDVVTADVVYLSGKENYLNVLDNGKPIKDASKTGAWSEGEFATGLQALFSPLTAAEFRNQQPATIANRPAWKYDFAVDQPHSAWRIEANGQTYKAPYSGVVWIDKETFRVLRIEMKAHTMPVAFPIDVNESSIDYNFVLIGDRTYLLPIHSESLSCWRGTKECSRNAIDFRNYSKYTANSTITFPDR